jgi:ubiquitin carboxyl-terminal hydrolase 16/45
MVDTRPRLWEADESSRSRDSKAPRLDLLAATATVAAEVDDLLGSRREDCTELTGNGDDDRCCDHVPTDSAHKDILSWSLLSDDAGMCEDCSREEGADGRPKYRRILVCLECGRHSCGDSRSYLPYGHARDHARQEQHWVAALFDDPQTGFCFKCECERPLYPEPDDELGTITGEIQAGGGGHVFGFDMPRDLATGLLNLGDAWRAAKLGSGNAEGYVIRGMPNRGNTCYMNATVQCLLALNKLWAWMLGPDPPPGHLGMALKELFVEASAADSAGRLLNPYRLLRSVRLHAGKYEAYKMHDSYELLESLRNALRDEESGIENPYRERGAPPIIDSIFRGELLETRSCIYCQFASTFHGHFWELSLSLPSKEDLSKSIKSQPMKAATQLLSASESNLGKIDAKSGDSHLLISEFNDLVADKTLDSMEVGEFLQSCTYSKFLTTDNGVCPRPRSVAEPEIFIKGGRTIR